LIYEKSNLNKRQFNNTTHKINTLIAPTIFLKKYEKFKRCLDIRMRRISFYLLLNFGPMSTFYVNYLFMEGQHFLKKIIKHIFVIDIQRVLKIKKKTLVVQQKTRLPLLFEPKK